MDIDLYYIVKGSGKPLILLHGNGEEHTYFAHQIEYFSLHYRVFAVDTRGHGSSPRGTAPFTISQFAEDLHDFVDNHEISKAYVLGFSDGGNIALTFALRYPERVDKLILNGANLFPAGVKPQVQIPILLQYYALSLFAGWMPKVKGYLDLLRLMVKEPNFRPEELCNLIVPTLVIAGEHDMIREEHTRLINASIPGSHLCILPGDHFLASKEYARFNEVVESFLWEC
ncbi:MAG: alpha/beta hydrolase [Ruminiclostridium sp.]|nr:alpha/beta hydrolase [Ruminiclostridium sp.]